MAASEETRAAAIGNILPANFEEQRARAQKETDEAEKVRIFY